MKDITFLNLIESYCIEVPNIQRDYAQGRNNSSTVKEIRDNFVKELANVLCNDNISTLRLNFIYGSTRTNAQRQPLFIPLDGQQRLTTLFLLHWYLCPKDELKCLQNHGENDLVTSKFSYNVRVSSKDFCNALVNHHRSDIKHGYKSVDNKKHERTLSEDIINESWFVWQWKSDPTIAGMLTMLEAFDLNPRLKETDDMLLWNRLKENRIVFNWMNLDEYNLTDDLYVKMNSRGRELSDFDKAKSTIEQYLYKAAYSASEADEKSTRAEEAMEKTHVWGTLVDNKWMNVFWIKFTENVDLANKEIISSLLKDIDRRYLRFMRRAMVYPIITNDKLFEHALETNDGKSKKEIRDRVLRKNILTMLHELDNLGLLNKYYFSELQTLIDCLFIDSKKESSQLVHCPAWWNMNNELDLLSLFTSINNNVRQIEDTISYPHRVLFYALLCFCRKNKDRLSGGTATEELNEWMRIMGNLIFNTTIDQSDTCVDVCQSIQRLSEIVYGEDNSLETGGSIIAYLAIGNRRIAGMNKLQVDEEQKKASLMSNPQWKELILEAENHTLLQGRLRMLFNTLDVNQTEDIERFKALYDGICNKFDYNGAMKADYKNGNKLLRAFLTHLQNDDSIWWSYKIFNNEAYNWRQIIRISANEESDHMKDWKQSLWQILPMTIDQLQVCDNLPDSLRKTISEPNLLKFVVDMRSCWIRWYHNHMAIYPSSEGVFLDAVLRDSVFCALSTGNYGKFQLLTGENVPNTTYFKGNDLQFKLNEHEYEWSDNEKVYSLNRYACEQSASNIGELCFSPKLLYNETYKTEYSSKSQNIDDFIQHYFIPKCLSLQSPIRSLHETSL